MREIGLIDRIRTFTETNVRNRGLIQGIGDDCAIFRPSPGQDLVFTTDFVLEGRHFTLKTSNAAEIGRHALARSLSDLAAMGAEPVFCLVSLAVPVSLSGAWLTHFYEGLLALAEECRISVAGGDLSRFRQVVADVMCCGRVPRGRALLRSGARPGDSIYVTGTLGGAAQRLITNLNRSRTEDWAATPRIAAGITLRKMRVSAAMDLSDGLSLDLHRLCLASNVAAHIDPAALPIAKAASLEQALHGGEDYELLFTAHRRLKIPKTIAYVPVTAIGRITDEKPGAIFLNNRVLKSKGFDHFDTR